MALLGLNHNVALALLCTLFSGISSGMMYFGVLPAYLYLLTGGSNTKVGAVEGVQGMLTTLTSIVIGYYTDLPGVKRQTILRIGGVLGLLGTGAIYGALFVENFASMWVALSLLGIVGAFSWGPLETILADSVETGRRSAIYTARTVLGLGSGCLGPLLAVVLFGSRENQWSLEECRFVLMIALVPLGFCSVLFFFFLDSKTLGAASEGLLHRSDGSSSQPTATDRAEPLGSTSQPFSASAIARGSSSLLHVGFHRSD
eukprot:RCo041161